MSPAQSLSPTERVIANRLNAHIMKNEEVSLTELAAECHVSKSTVVKMLQKIGYQGYQEFAYNYRISRDVQQGSLLPRELVMGDEEEAVALLSETFSWCEDKKNIVFLGGRRMGALLASYVSRKLAMFDIFAPASYDYAMVGESRMQTGAALFFYHRHPGLGMGFSGTGESMVVVAKELGYRVVVFSDADDSELARRADVLFRICPNTDPTLDLFATRTIMLVERALGAYAKMRRESVSDGQV